MLSLRRYLNVVYVLLIEKTRGEGVSWTKAQQAIDDAIAPPEDQALVAARQNMESMRQLSAMMSGLTPGPSRA